SASDRHQLRLDGLGAQERISVWEDMHSIKMTMIKPRLDNYSTEELETEALINWGREYVKPRAERASNRDGEFKAGEHCRFCKIKHSCRTRDQYKLDIPNK
ncbi:DUF2800 domain-containing protein, partial [Staphylococcus pseudintermedius]|uniref:DUF2800 domain-containing protein n=1 Tax=Staphylococcus pseudintermedius TaxID=283734 RepID=UPI000E39C74C